MRKALVLLVLLAACGGGGGDDTAEPVDAEPTTTTEAEFDVEAEFLRLQGDADGNRLLDLGFDCDLAQTIERFASEQAEPNGGRRTGLVSTEWNALPDEFVDGILDDVEVRWPQLLSACEEHNPLDG